MLGTFLHEACWKINTPLCFVFHHILSIDHFRFYYEFGVFAIFINDRVGDNIHVMSSFEIEDDAVVEQGKTVKIADYLVKRAEENVGQLYLFDPTMTIVDYTGDTCGLCGKSDSEILALRQPGMHTWELPNYYLLFLPTTPVQPLFEDALENWTATGDISAVTQQRLKENKASVEIYDEQWNRIEVIGERYEKLNKPQLLEEKYDIFEHAELKQSTALANDKTFVVRMPNPSYKPFEEPFNKAMVLFVSIFFGDILFCCWALFSYLLVFHVNSCDHLSM